jgi:hypothetical protein
MRSTGETNGAREILEALGSLGDFIGGIGVIVTLVYLAMQIRQNTRSVRAASAQQVLSGAAEFLEHVSADPILADLFTRGGAHPDSLSPAERARQGLLLMALYRRYESVYRQHERGTVASEDWAGLRVSMSTMSRRPFARAWWPETAPLFSPGFRSFIDSIQNEGAAEQRAEATEPRPPSTGV